MDAFIDYRDGYSALEATYIIFFVAVSLILSIVKLKGHFRSSTVCVVGRLTVIIPAAAQFIFDLATGTIWERWCWKGGEECYLPLIFVFAYFGFEVITRGADELQRKGELRTLVDVPISRDADERP